MALGSILSGIGSVVSAFKKPDTSAARKGIQWRVADAKAAGIHPLAAMGLPITGPTYTAGGPGEALQGMGQAVQDIQAGRAQRAQASQAVKESDARIQASLSSAKRDDAEAALALSQAARIRETANARQDSVANSVAGPQAQAQKNWLGTPYTTRGGDVRESDLGGFWGEVQNFLHGALDPALNPMAPAGKAIGTYLGKSRRRTRRPASGRPKHMNRR